MCIWGLWHLHNYYSTCQRGFQGFTVTFSGIVLFCSLSPAHGKYIKYPERPTWGLEHKEHSACSYKSLGQSGRQDEWLGNGAAVPFPRGILDKLASGSLSWVKYIIYKSNLSFVWLSWKHEHGERDSNELTRIFLVSCDASNFMNLQAATAEIILP